MEIQFTWNGKEYQGELKPVSGAASGSMYHLMVKGYYQGQLVNTAQGWQFSNQKHGVIESLSLHFGICLNKGMDTSGIIIRTD